MREQKRLDILTVGSIHIDIFADTIHTLKLPQINDVPGNFTLAIGGTVFNVSCGLKALGASPFLLSALKKNSIFTLLVKHKLREIGIDHHLILDEKLNDSAFMALRQNGDLVAAITASALDNLSDEMLVASLRKIISERKFNAIILDCNLSASNIITILKTIPHLPVFVCATSTFKVKKLTCLDGDIFRKIKAIFMNNHEYEAVADLITERIKKYDTTLFITEGEHGVRIITTHKTLKFPAENLHNIGSLSGAGDAFASGVIYGLLNGMTLKNSILLGFKCVSQKVMYRSANILDLTIESVCEVFGIDRLTLCYNRNYFEEERDSVIQKFSHLLLVDIDHFKKINDTYGHDFGDEVLRKVAEVIRKNLRSSDRLYRYGGEEFLVLLRNTDDDQALQIAERIRRKIKEETPVTITVGVSKIQDSIDQTIRLADKALYKGKNSGRDRVIFMFTDMCL